MKKYVLNFGLIIVAFAALLTACEQGLFEGDGSNKVSLSVDEARVWFENNQPEFLVLKSTDTEKNKKVIKPKWDGAFSSQN